MNACADGDLQIESDFENVAASHCSELNQTDASFLFKVNDTEAIILELPAGALNNGNSETTPVVTELEISGEAELIYRFF